MSHEVKNSDILIVGGGVIGLLSAYFLQKEGAEITILDKAEVGKESSWAGGGILSPLYPWRYADPVNQLSSYSQKHYQQLCSELEKVTGISPQWLQSGLLMLDCDDDSSAIQSWTNTFQKKLTKLTASQLQDYEPQIGSGYTQGIFQNDVAQIRNPWLVRSMKSYLISKKVRFIENTTIKKIETSRQKVTGVSCESNTYQADKVIIASGAWSSLFPEMKMLDVRPVMGQMILFKTEPQWLKRIVMHNGKYVIPRADGHILCGSTIEWNGYQKHTSEKVREELHAAAIRMIPGLKAVPIIKQWSGLRPGSPNGVPYIGEHPDISGLYANTGHYRYGVVMGLASAQLMADIITGKESFIDKSLFALTAKREPTAEFA